MKLIEAYRNQSSWRNWDSYIKCLPIKKSDAILDLGCSNGDVTKLLAQKASKVIGIDLNSELINEAKADNSSINIQYMIADLKKLNEVSLPLVDGIWTSFTVAYFPDFTPILNTWLNLLKPNGWIAIVEMSDLFAHFPLSENTQQKFKEHYLRQRQNHIYDFEMGSKIKKFLIHNGLKIIYEENKTDQELTFNGSVNKQILTAWENRFDRMISLHDFLGDHEFQAVKNEFIECLANQNHTSKTEIKFIIAKKN